MSLQSRRSAYTALALLLSLACADCGEYAHRNPYDPDTATRITISGPDTLWSIGEIAQYTATVSPTLPDSGIVWGPLVGNGPTDVIFPVGRGKYQSLKIGTATVVAIVGRHEGVKQVVVRQRAARVFLFCPRSCTTLAMGPVGVIYVLSVVQYDAHGNALEGTQPRSAVAYSSRNPAIVAIEPASGTPTGVAIRAVANGSTYVRAVLGDWADSVLVTVGP